MFYFDKYKENAKKTIANQKTKTIQKTRRKTTLKENVELAIANQKTKTIQKTKRKTTLKSQSSHILPGLPILNVDKEKETWDNDNYKSKDKYICTLVAGL